MDGWIDLHCLSHCLSLEQSRVIGLLPILGKRCHLEPGSCIGLTCICSANSNYTVVVRYIWCFWQGEFMINGNITRMYMVLANPTHVSSRSEASVCVKKARNKEGRQQV